MKNGDNKGIIILMGVIIIILVVLCVLFATNTITFNSKVIKSSNQNNVNDKSEKENSQQNIEDDDLNNTERTVSNVYCGYFMEKGYSTMLVLYNDNTFKKCDRHECLNGAYTLDNNKLNLTTDSFEEYPTSMKYTYTLTKNDYYNELISDNQNEYVNLKEISEKNVEKVYYGYFSNNNISYSTGLILYKDNTFEKCDRYECFEGKYTLNNDKLSLVTDSTEEYPISLEYNYTISSKNGENMLNSLKPNEYASLKELN